MNNSTLHNLFYNVCDKFYHHKCVIYANNVEQTRQTVLEYGEMKQLIQEVTSVLHEFNISKFTGQFIGVISRELSPEILSIVIAIINSGNAFAFIDSSSKVLHLIDKLSIKWIIGEETILKDPLSSISVSIQKSFKLLNTNFVIWELERNVSSTEYMFAFAVMSSGSTGEPKIIKVMHEAIVPNVLELGEIYNLQPNDIVYISTPLTFDPCIVDIFLALHSGASILLPSNDLKFNSNFLTRIFSNYVTVWYTTPSIFFKCFPRIKQSSLRVLILGGEKFPSLNLKLWPFLKNISVYNIYGITEVSCWASLCRVTDYDSVSLGNTLSDVIFEIRSEVDDDRDIGELFIGSERRKCVVNNDVSVLKENLFFRATGDLVKVENKQYYYIGRKDRRIKLFGHFIDLSVIESEISKNSSVKCCSCVFIQEENKIVAFVECYDHQEISDELENSLKTELPSVMMPSHLFFEKIPVNAHGKICEKSCKRLYYELKARKGDIAPLFENLWKRYTNAESGISMGFIDSGGSSIEALQFATILSDICQLPQNFIAFLLSNKNYGECWKLVENLPICRTDNDSQNVTQLSSIPVREEIKMNLPNPKRFKSSSFGELIQMKCKGKTINYKNFQDKPILSIKNLQIKWRYNLEKCIDGSPTLIIYENQSIVIGASHSGLIAIIDFITGQIISKIKLPDRIESSASVSNCGKFFFIGCYDQNMYCINIINGNIQWRYETGGMIKSIPIISGDELYFGSYDHNFYCLTTKTGSLLWKIDVDESSIYVSPLVDNKIIIATLGGTIAILERDGIVFKRTRFHQKHFFSSPVQLLNKKQFLIIDVTGTMLLFDLISGCQLWQFEVGGNVFSSIILVDENKVVFGCQNKNLYCFEIIEDAPKLIWEKQLNSSIYSTPYGFQNENDGYIAVTCTDGHVYILDNCGNCKIKYCVEGEIFSSPVIHNNCIVFGNRNNILYCFEIT